MIDSSVYRLSTVYLLCECVCMYDNVLLFSNTATQYTTVPKECMFTSSLFTSNGKVSQQQLLVSEQRQTILLSIK